MLATGFKILNMCKVTNYISPNCFGILYDIVRSQMKFIDMDTYRKEATDIYNNQFAVWERLEGSANGDYGCIGINLISVHRHLKLSKRTSPFSIIKELREYFVLKIGLDIFKDMYTFWDWEKQFDGQRFECVQHKFTKLVANVPPL